LTSLFESIITSYISDGVGQSLDFMPLELAENLRRNLDQHHTNVELKHAGIGQNQDFQQDSNYRKDKIHWLEPETTDVSERAFFQLMDSWVEFLNRTCFTGISNYEFHYALYEEGSYYRRHLDQFANNDSRVFSMIIYLNEDWKDGDGGELIIYKENEHITISPSKHKLVFFDSSVLEHEVLTTRVPRKSITGWLKR
jgi:SM-20-related protein